MTKQSRFTSHCLPLAAFALALGAAGGAIAADATATLTSTVVTPLTIAKDVDLSFGSFAAGASTGTVTVSPDNTRSASGGAVAMGGTATAAQFTVNGQSGMGYGIVLGGSTELLSGTDSMAFTPISDVGTATAKTSGTVASGNLTAGTQKIYVGGSLAVAANQPAGNYTGSLTVTVTYN